jgi:hypothetical protein
MGVEVFYLDDGQGVLFNCHDVLCGRELIDALKALPSGGSFSSIKYALIDETAVESLDLSVSDVYDIFRQHKRLAALTPHRPIIAIDAPSHTGYGLARMWESLAGQLQWNVRVFTSRPEAARWLTTAMRETYNVDIRFE